MSVWPRSSFAPFVSEPSFTPLFKLLDEFDNYSGRGSNKTSMKAFQPKFDVKEVESAYTLHGELPGIDQKDVEIEFVDQQTLNIRGRTERSYENGTHPSGFIEGERSSGAITEGGESNNTHKATVEDEGAQSTSTEVAQTKQQEEPKEESKYWVSERSVGEFSRTFSFPVRVDQDAVKASMKNGILSIVVPKAKKAESRKIAIN